eukprot:Lankesteria_metandrocarpae@DN3484_c0_g1_i1.p1
MVRVTSEDICWDESVKDFLSADDDDDLTDVKDLGQVAPSAAELSGYVVVSGLPKTEVSKREKLIVVLHTNLTKAMGEIKLPLPSPSDISMEMPTDEEGSSLSGCAILTISTHDSAAVAANIALALDKFVFAGKHILRACQLSNFDALLKDKNDTREQIRKGLRWWLTDPDHFGFGQFVTRFKDTASIYWHDPVGREPLAIEPKAKIVTRGKVCWSSMGSYLCTFHKPGIKLLGKSNFDVLVRLPHVSASEICFSPNEEYVATYGETAAAGTVVVWHVITGKRLAEFETATAMLYDGTSESLFVMWSFDSTQFAMMVGKDGVQSLTVISVPSMIVALDLPFGGPKMPPSMIGQSAASRPPVQLAWSPSQNIISVFSLPNKVDDPSRVVLIEIPSNIEKASKNLYNVKDARSHWQSKGAYMSLHSTLVRKTGKKSRKEFSQIEIFRMREKNVPVDTVQLEDHKVLGLHWETGSNRFSITVQEENSHNRVINFYSVSLPSAVKRETLLVCSFEVNHTINHVSWSPLGSNFVATAFEGGDGGLIFGSLTEQNKVDVYSRDEHLNVNRILWDESGRYILTAVCVQLGEGENWKLSSRAGYRAWSMHGKLIYFYNIERFYGIEWRPRPPRLLNAEAERDVHRNLKAYSKRFDEEDHRVRNEKQAAFDLQRKQMENAFFSLYNGAIAQAKQHPKYESWQKAGQDLESRFEYEIQHTITEEVISERTEIIP